MHQLSNTPPNVKRPLSPHLLIYRPQLTSVLSILHRITGVGLFAGLIVLVAWLVALAWGPRQYDCLMTVLTHPIGRVFLFGWTFALFYHLGCGIRHLLWSAGWCIDIKSVNSSGRILIFTTLLITVGLWVKVLGLMPMI